MASDNGTASALFGKKRAEFLCAAGNVERTQAGVLMGIVRANAWTRFGKSHGFSGMASVEDFRKNVPVSVYEDYTGAIESISAGEEDVLTPGRIELLEPSSGSTGASKLVPYNAGLKAEFNRGLEPWLSDLYLNFPDILGKPAYWLITPAGCTAGYTAGGVKIGFDSDAAYLNDEFSLLLQRDMFVPESVRRAADMEAFEYATLMFLLSKPDLALISVWNPAVLLILMDTVRRKREQIAADIENRTLSCAMTPELAAGLCGEMGFTEARKEELKRLLSEAVVDVAGLWSGLRVISCWADGNAAPYAEKLKALFPAVHIQPKGLLATEGIMTIPIEGIGKMPCVGSHFFEFIENGGTGPGIRLLHELEEGREYSILLTTSGGLYRYEIGDVVRVNGRYGNCPLLEFTGKKDNVSDYFGEKVSEGHVREIAERFGIPARASFYLFAPVKSGDGFFYAVYLEPAAAADMAQLKKLEAGIEAYLRGNFNYNQCRELGQLQRFRIYLTDEGGNAGRRYLEQCVAGGMRYGNIKPSAFSNKCNWEFKGGFIS